MKIVEGFCLREILDETVAVPTGQAAESLSGLISLNETAAFLFRQLQSEQTEGSLVKSLLENYETDQETASRDVNRFLEVMRRHGLLRDDSPGGQEAKL